MLIPWNHIVKQVKRNCVPILIILSVSAAASYNYFFLVDLPNVNARIELHRQIVNGTAPSPYLYRILAPYSVEGVAQMVSHFTSYRNAFLLSYGAFDLLSISLTLVVLYAYLRLWFQKNQSMFGTLFVAGVITIALRDHYFQPWSLLETAFFTMALYFIHQNNRSWLLVTVALASLNRETAVFIPVALLITKVAFDSNSRRKVKLGREDALTFVAAAATCTLILGAIRLALGTSHRVITVEEIWTENIVPSNIVRSLVNNALFVGVFWFLAVKGYGKAPHFLKRTAWVAPLIVIPVLAYNLWWEVRPLMPLYAILVPLALSFLSQQEHPETVIASR